jgi:hypothetical protein
MGKKALRAAGSAIYPTAVTGAFTFIFNLVASAAC